MTKFKKIKEIIEAYRKTADRQYADYRAKEKKAREDYSERGFSENFIQKIYPAMAGKIWAECDDTIRKVEEVFSETEHELKKWVMEPLDGSTVQILDCVERFGLSLSLNELQVLEGSVRSSYLGTKIFAGLAEKNGYSVNAPSMKEYQDALAAARNNTKLAIRAYAGLPNEGYPGKDLLQKWENKGVVLGEYQHYHLFFAANFLHEGGELDRLEEMWGEARAPMVYRLNESEVGKVKKAVENIMQGGEVDKKAAQDLIKKDPDFKDKLQSMPEDFFEGKESVVNYFSLKENENKNEESLISPGTKKVAEYAATKFKKVEAEDLKNFA